MSRRAMAPRFDDGRPPLVRLESLVAERDVGRSRRLLGRIREEAFRAPEPGPWIAAARALEERGLISNDGFCYLVEIFLEGVTAHSATTDPEMVRLEEEMRAVERTHGLGDDEAWYVGEAPIEWQALNAAWERRDAEIRIATLRALGHTEVADRMERDPAAFEGCCSIGLDELWGELDDEA